MNIQIQQELEQIIEAQIATGRYASSLWDFLLLFN